MPRSKLLATDPFFREYFKIGNFKSYSTDLLFDFETIYRIQFERFEDFMNEPYKAEHKKMINRLHKAKSGLKLINNVRVYLTTNLIFVPLFMVNTEACILDNFELLYDFPDEDAEWQLSPQYLTNLFVFKGSELAFRRDLSIGTAMKILIAFQKENLINAGAFRDEWYGEPRQRERREKRLLDKTKP